PPSAPLFPYTTLFRSEKFRELSLRDQSMLIVLAAAVILYLLVLVAWRPLAQSNRSLQQSNAVLRDSVQNINQLAAEFRQLQQAGDRKSTRLNSSHVKI